MDNSIVIDVFVDYLILNARQIFKDNIKILSKIPVNQLSSFVLENYYELIVANLRLVSKNILSVIDFNYFMLILVFLNSCFLDVCYCLVHCLLLVVICYFIFVDLCYCLGHTLLFLLCLSCCLDDVC